MNLILISKKFFKIAVRPKPRNLSKSIQKKVDDLKSKKRKPDSFKDMINKFVLKIFGLVSIYVGLVLHTPAHVAIATEKVTTLPAVRNQLVIPKPKSIENVTPGKKFKK